MKKVLILLLLFAAFIPKASAEYSMSEYIATAFSDGVISGDESGNFHADKAATRAEFAVMLTRFLNIDGGMNVFSDVRDGDWYADALSAANYHGLIVGDEYGRAKPQDLISRQDAITILGRWFAAESENRAETEGVSEYAVGYYAYALENNLLDTQNEKAPQEFVTKGELVKLMYDYDIQSTAKVRFLTKYPRLASEGVFNHISIEVRTNKPCTIYYGLAEAGAPYYNADTKLCEITNPKAAVSVSIGANSNVTYDVYLKAVTADGISGGTAVIKNVQPFAIAAGDGSEDMPYVIYTEQQLAQVSARPDKCYRLGSDIEVSGSWNGVEDFSGTFDGNGYRISGITIDKNAEAVGLFKKITGGTVKNLAVDAVINTKKNAGIIAGKNEGGSILNCSVTGSVSANTDNAGGICGTNSGTIRNCLSAVYSVVAGSFAGGIAGQNFGTVENCIAAVEVVAADMYAGGICGTNDNGRIDTCVSACMTVYDTLTKNSGRLTTNKKSGITKNNYCYEDVNSNASYEEPGRFSQNGYDVSWQELCTMSFYEGIGFAQGAWTAVKGGFRLICPKNVSEPQLLAGKTMYFPKAVTSAAELRAIDENEAGHYILTKDITIDLPWKTICAKNGFSGSLDGDGHTIYSLNLKSEAGMFSNITGGTVRNLTLRDVKASLGTSGAILTACNYGYIINCKIYGKIDTKKSGYVGGIAGENHGEIDGCDVVIDININNNNITVGGICAENGGRITDSVYRGVITLSGENAVAGGICGYNAGGDIFECFSGAEILGGLASGYVGGICGINEAAGVYKCASAGRIVSDDADNVYIGGICGLVQEATVYNCFSNTDIYVSAEGGYAGGIVGCNSASNVQNTYSSGNVVTVGELAVGGICGYAENGFVMQNVSLNSAINGLGSIGAIVGEYELSEVSDNYSCDKTLINSKYILSSVNNGTVKSLSVLKNTDFYYKPISEGGLLGWGSDKYGEEIWTQNSIRGYSFPRLCGVREQEVLKMPVYK
ncbi:MAG: S-layer homology domain-containing protein [Clostridia bacterium]|nr:S-layer homology domain-containing protein [Clostridia bacterium]